MIASAFGRIAAGADRVEELPAVISGGGVPHFSDFAPEEFHVFHAFGLSQRIPDRRHDIAYRILLFQGQGNHAQELREVSMAGGTDQQAVDFFAFFLFRRPSEPGAAAVAIAQCFEFPFRGCRHGTAFATVATHPQAGQIAAAALFVQPEPPAFGFLRVPS